MLDIVSTRVSATTASASTKNTPHPETPPPLLPSPCPISGNPWWAVTLRDLPVFSGVPVKGSLHSRVPRRTARLCEFIPGPPGAGQQSSCWSSHHCLSPEFDDCNKATMKCDRLCAQRKTAGPSGRWMPHYLGSLSNFSNNYIILHCPAV